MRGPHTLGGKDTLPPTLPAQGPKGMQGSQQWEGSMWLSTTSLRSPGPAGYKWEQHWYKGSQALNCISALYLWFPTGLGERFQSGLRLPQPSPAAQHKAPWRWPREGGKVTHTKEKWPRGGINEVITKRTLPSQLNREKDSKIEREISQSPNHKVIWAPKNRGLHPKIAWLLEYSRLSYPKLENMTMEAHLLRRAWHVLVREW